MRRVALFLLACMAFAGAVWLMRTPRLPDPSPVDAATGPPDIAEEPVEPSGPVPIEASDAAPLPDVLVDPAVVIEKQRRALTVYSAGAPVKTYLVALGREPVGDKEVEGDGRTPEGEFYVCMKNPESRYHRALGLSYPNDEDAGRGLAAGLITSREHRQILEANRHFTQPPWKTALGGEIMIHGAGTLSDWTQGCIALDDPDVAELFDALPLGTPITIVP